MCTTRKLYKKQYGLTLELDNKEPSKSVQDTVNSF